MPGEVDSRSLEHRVECEGWEVEGERSKRKGRLPRSGLELGLYSLNHREARRVWSLVGLRYQWWLGRTGGREAAGESDGKEN